MVAAAAAMVGSAIREGSPQLRTKESSEGDSGQVFSVSMSWYSVPKGEGGKKSQEEKKRWIFSSFPTFY